MLKLFVSVCRLTVGPGRRLSTYKGMVKRGWRLLISLSVALEPVSKDTPSATHDRQLAYLNLRGRRVTAWRLGLQWAHAHPRINL